MVHKNANTLFFLKNVDSKIGEHFKNKPQAEIWKTI